VGEVREHAVHGIHRHFPQLMMHSHIRGKEKQER
jgi:hypothetical protein